MPPKELENIQNLPVPSGRGVRGEGAENHPTSQSTQSTPPQRAPPGAEARPGPSSTAPHGEDKGSGASPAGRPGPSATQPAHTPMVNPLQDRVPPSDDEQRAYYHFLAGRPRLVARTSTTAFEYNPMWGSGNGPKRLFTVGSDPALHMWSRKLSLDIALTLHRSRIDWDVFFPLRTLLPGDRCPKVLFVVVHPDAARTWQQAMRTALECRDVLVQHNVHGVEVEMMEGSSQPHAAKASGSRAFERLAESLDFNYSSPTDPDFEPSLTLAGINAAIQALLPLPGHAIEQAKDGQPAPQQGSLGFFFRLVNPSQPELQSPVYALTSRHVAVGRRRPNNYDVRSSAALSTNASATDHEDIVMVSSHPSRSGSRITSAFVALYRPLKKELGAAETSNNKNPDDAFVSRLLELHVNAHGYMNTLKQAIGSGMAYLEPSDYVLGPVVLSRGQQTGRFGEWVDWAMVKMQNTSTNAVNQVSNKLYLAQRKTEDAMSDVDVLRRKPYHTSIEDGDINFLRDLDHDGYLRLHGCDIPVRPPFVADNNGARKSLIVGNIGAMTGLTYGVTNEIEAVRRLPSVPQGNPAEPVVAFQMLVLSLNKEPFSERGDSGSAVFDTRGGIVGILDAGLEAGKVERYWQKPQPAGGFTGHLNVQDVPNQDEPPRGFTHLVYPKTGEIWSLLDVSFVTPIQWVVDDIARFTGLEVEII